LKDAAEALNLPKDLFQAHSQLSKADFVKQLEAIGADLEPLQQAKPMLQGLIGLDCAEEEQKAAVMALLDHQSNLWSYCYQHIEEAYANQESFYLIDARFFNSWAESVGFSGKDATFAALKKDRVKEIDNSRFLQPLHEKRLKEIQEEQDFKVVPASLFRAFSRWYVCKTVIERKVVKLKAKGKISQLLPSNSVNALEENKEENTLAIQPLKGKQHSIAASFKQTSHQLTKNVGFDMFELELFPRFIYFQKVGLDGLKPHEKAIQNKKVDFNYVKKTLKSDKVPFQELYVSKTVTVDQLLQQISEFYGEKKQRARLWLNQDVINATDYELSLEEFGMSDGSFVYVEFADLNNMWPSDKVSRFATKSFQNSEASLQQPQLTKGLINLGNTCYMNAALQCLANTKFFHEYFIKTQKFKGQTNLTSKLGYQGALVYEFAELLTAMFGQEQAVGEGKKKLLRANSGLGQNQRHVRPDGFKKMVGELQDQFQGFQQHDSQEFLAFPSGLAPRRTQPPQKQTLHREPRQRGQGPQRVGPRGLLQLPPPRLVLPLLPLLRPDQVHHQVLRLRQDLHHLRRLLPARTPHPRTQGAGHEHHRLQAPQLRQRSSQRGGPQGLEGEARKSTL